MGTRPHKTGQGIVAPNPTTICSQYIRGYLCRFYLTYLTMFKIQEYNSNILILIFFLNFVTCDLTFLANTWQHAFAPHREVCSSKLKRRLVSSCAKLSCTAIDSDLVGLSFHVKIDLLTHQNIAAKSRTIQQKNPTKLHAHTRLGDRGTLSVNQSQVKRSIGSRQSWKRKLNPVG